MTVRRNLKSAIVNEVFMYVEVSIMKHHRIYVSLAFLVCLVALAAFNFAVPSNAEPPILSGGIFKVPSISETSATTEGDIVVFGGKTYNFRIPAETIVSHQREGDLKPKYFVVTGCQVSPVVGGTIQKRYPW